MKRNVAKLSCLLTLSAFMACDELSVNETAALAPEITSFSPMQGSVGTEVEIEGAYLNNVVSASIGGVSAELSQKISNQKLNILVPANAVTGKIVLTNAVGDGTSADDFIVEYPVPVAAVSSIPSEVEMGNKLLIRGTNMNVITAVTFTAEGMSVGHEAETVSQGESEIVVKVPYVEDEIAYITFTYFNGEGKMTTSADELPSVKVLRYEPVVTTTWFETVSVGDAVTLSGSYLNKIDAVTVNGVECVISSQAETTLVFTIPTSSSFEDGDNVCTLAITYFDGVETVVITDSFIVNVPYVYFWQDITVYGQGRDVEEMVSFFSPETGIAYHNSYWRDTVDPIAYQYQANTCSAAQTPAVSEEEYDSVAPYFFFSGVSAGNLQINSPAGSSSQLKNFYFYNNSSSEYRVTGANADCYGTPVLTYLWLNPETSAHLEVIKEVAESLLETIDETTFPIDTDAKTCRGISISGVSNSIKDTTFAPDVFVVGEEKSVDLDSYMLVFYYNHRGLDSSNRSLNIKRIGLLHIKHIDFKLYNNTNAPSSSSITFDMYWMKHDYGE